jgi:hypothetical protein
MRARVAEERTAADRGVPLVRLAVTMTNREGVKIAIGVGVGVGVVELPLK